MEAENIDTSWINEFEEEDESYSMFYKEKVEDIAKAWKSGDVEYTATFKGEPDPDVISPPPPTTDE